MKKILFSLLMYCSYSSFAFSFHDELLYEIMKKNYDYSKIKELLSNIQDLKTLQERMPEDHRCVTDHLKDFQGDGLTIFHIALICTHLNVLDLLLQRVPDSINICDKNGFSLLAWACFADNVHIARYLLKQGADTTIAGSFTGFNSENKETPLFIACDQNSPEIVSLLLHYNASLRDKNDAGTLLDVAIKGGIRWGGIIDTIEIIEELFSHASSNDFKFLQGEGANAVQRFVESPSYCTALTQDVPGLSSIQSHMLREKNNYLISCLEPLFKERYSSFKKFHNTETPPMARNAQLKKFRGDKTVIRALSCRSLGIKSMKRGKDTGKAMTATSRLND